MRMVRCPRHLKGAPSMLDVYFVAGSVVFFILGALFVRACDLI
jgi:hypothetical protein